MEQRYNCPTDKLDAVLQAGLDEFSRRSFADANTETITQAAGISKGLLFHYFGSKKAFYLFCLQTALERLMAETPAPESDDFFEILFFVMDEKIRLCRDFPKETLFVNLAARDAAAGISAEKQALFSQYTARTAAVSRRVLSRAIGTLPLKDPSDPKLLDALMLYIHAINQNYLLRYRETPELFFEHAPKIQREMRTYIHFMLDGIVRKGE